MRTKKGTIVSAKMTGTVAVETHRYVTHPIYKKRFRKSKKYLADTGEFKDLAEGDTVVITECRPISKNKCFRVTEVLEKAVQTSAAKVTDKETDEVINREKEAPAKPVEKVEEKEVTTETEPESKPEPDTAS